MAKYHLTWDSYKNNICNGFSHLQAHEELVDMTLAAEGYLVKAHKTLLALASPYLKEVIQSAPCQHPIVFLTNVSHVTLGYLLEYVYSGEVVVPCQKMEDFVKAAKALRIIGIDSLIPPTVFQNMKIPQRQSRTKSLQEKSTMETNTNVIEESAINFSKELQNNTAQVTAEKSSDDDILSDCEVLSSDLNSSQIKTNILQETICNKKIGKNNIQTTEPHIGIEKSHNDTDFEELVSKTTLIPNQAIADSKDDREQCMDIDTDLECDLNIKQEETSEHTIPETIKNYSVNLNFPDKRLPAITIKAETIENMLPVNENDFEDDNNKQNDKPSTSIPKITINSGGIQNIPGISITNVDKTQEPDMSDPVINDTQASSPLYMISSKGKLQMILNRFIYGINYHTKRDKKLRWRCINYRHHRCPAYVDSLEDVIVSRKFPHNHPFHDDKIMERGRVKNVYESLGEVLKVLETHEAK